MVTRYSQSGYTLIELLTVLVILSIVFTYSASFVQKFSDGQSISVSSSQVSSVVRAARNFSRSSGLSSRVHVDSEAGRVSAFGFETVASWDFESLEGVSENTRLNSTTRIDGAFGEKAEVTGWVEATGGRVGRAVQFVDDGAALVAPGLSRYHSRGGISVEAWVRYWQPQLQPDEGIETDGGVTDPRREMRLAVVSRPGSWEMGLLGDGAAYFALGDLEDETREQSCLIATEGRVAVPQRWAHLRATFDGISFLIEVDGIARNWIPVGFERIAEEDWPPLPDRLLDSNEDLWISNPTRFFLGAIDEVKVRVALEPQSYDLPGTVEILGPSQLIHFDTRGSLDPLIHEVPIVVTLAELGEGDLDPTATAVENPTFRSIQAQKNEDREETMETIEEAFGDPLSGLARFLENWQSDPDEGDEKKGPVLPTEPGLHVGDGVLDGRPVKKLHNIVIDMTGTIRG